MECRIAGGERNRERTSPMGAVGMTRKDEHALALATIIGGLDLGFMEDTRAQDLLPSPDDYRPERFKAITGKYADVEVPALGPSLVGESFVLALPASKIDKTLRSLAGLAFKLNAVAASQFVLHACMDFPSHANVEQLLPTDLGSLLNAHPVLAGGEEDWSVTYMASALALAYALLGMPTQIMQVCETILVLQL